jgi:hypothetical protein
MKKILFIVLLVCIKQVNAQVCFIPYDSIAGGRIHILSVINGDFNGDGFDDLATANDSNVGTISVLLGNGTGSFGVASHYFVGAYPNSLVCADFNSDGKADLAVSNNSSGNVSILLGTGTGSFGTATNFSVGTDPMQVIIADFNGDGKTDLATPNYISHNVSVLLGDGMGSFGVTNFNLGYTPVGLASADFNTDGKADLVVCRGDSNYVSVFSGSGTGSFGSPVNFIAGRWPQNVISADFNGDGKIDLATANWGTNNASVLLGTGTGSFGAPANFPVGTSPVSLTNADYNSDGITDLVISNQYSYNVSLLLGNGTGSFGIATYFSLGATNSEPKTVISRDFNGDSKVDLAVAVYCEHATNSVDILLNCTPTPTCVASVTDSLFNISPLNWGVIPHYSSQVTSAVWYWGDGTSSTGLYPSHTYTTSGWYNICVTAYASCGDSVNVCRNDTLYKSASNNSIVNVNVMPATAGVNQLSVNKNELSVYPNPANNDVIIQSATELGAISIYNALGNIVYQTKSRNTQEQIDISKLSAGVYMIQAQNKYLKLIKE